MYLLKLLYSNQINKTNTQRFLKINISTTFHFLAAKCLIPCGGQMEYNIQNDVLCV